ncbi:hypothetical protein BASA81_000093 [Batrachochytrium salamandrivorans]|nr:hypothetical protein BASA81_000093 [Batrachochytrium salamandrivorans]
MAGWALAILYMTMAAAWQHKLLAGLSTSFCALQLDGQIYCSGYNGKGNLGVGQSTEDVLSPTRMLHVTNATNVCMGDAHTCLVDQAGQAKCVGYNAYYQLGNGKESNTNKLTNVTGLKRNVAQVFAGSKSTCALLVSGGVQCWGNNLFGGLGDGTGRNSKFPTLMVGFENSGVGLVAVGEYHSCLITHAGKAWCMGYNLYGQLGGNLAQTSSLVPVPVTLSSRDERVFVSISCGDQHTCAVTNLGAVFCWGSNRYSQLGRGPQPVIPSQATLVWSSGYNTFALLSDGTARAFGFNNHGELGTGNRMAVRKPVVLAPRTRNNTIRQVRGGEHTTCLLFEDGSIKCLGTNSHGQFGIST